MERAGGLLAAVPVGETPKCKATRAAASPTAIGAGAAPGPLRSRPRSAALVSPGWLVLAACDAHERS